MFKGIEKFPPQDTLRDSKVSTDNEQYEQRHLHKSLIDTLTTFRAKHQTIDLALKEQGI